MTNEGSAVDRKFNIYYDSLKYEKARFDSFVGWPKKKANLVKILTKEGIYYLGFRDHCECIFCKGKIKEWNVHFILNTIKKGHMPNCPFKDGKPVGNVKMKQCFVLDELTSQLENPKDSYNMRFGPRFFNFNNYETRLESFRDKHWPRNDNQEQENLALAGFFYTGEFYPFTRQIHTLASVDKGGGVKFACAGL